MCRQKMLDEAEKRVERRLDIGMGRRDERDSRRDREACAQKGAAQAHAKPKACRNRNIIHERGKKPC